MSYETFRDLALLLGPGIILESLKKQDSKNYLQMVQFCQKSDSHVHYDGLPVGQYMPP